RLEAVVLGQHAALEAEAGADAPVEVELADVEVVLDLVGAHADGGQGPAFRIGRVDAVVDYRRPLVAAVVVAVAVDVELVHHDRRLHGIVVPGRGGAELAGQLEAVAELVLAGQADLLEDRIPLVVAVLGAHVDVVEAAVQQRTRGRVDVAVADDGLGLAALRGRAAEGDRLDVVLAAGRVDLRVQAVQRGLGVVAGLELQRGGHAGAVLVVLHPGVAREARVEHVGGHGIGEGRGRIEAAVAGAVGPAAGAGALLQRLALGVGHRQQGAEPAVGPGVGDQAGHARGGVAGHVVVGGLRAGGDGEAAVVERTRGDQVDRGAQRALLDVGLRGLAHDHLREQVRGEDVEVEAAGAVGAAVPVGGAGRGQRLHAVDAHAGEVRAQAADGDVAALAGVTGDDHAG